MAAKTAATVATAATTTTLNVFNYQVVNNNNNDNSSRKEWTKIHCKEIFQLTVCGFVITFFYFGVFKLSINAFERQKRAWQTAQSVAKAV